MSSADKAQQKVEQSANSAQRNLDQSSDSVERNLDKANASAHRAIDKTTDAVDRNYNAAKDTADQVKNSAQRNYNEAKDAVERNVDKAEEVAERNYESAKRNAEEAKQTIVQKLREDGVVNPKGLAVLGFSGIFFAAIPVSNWIAQPNGLLEKAVNGVCSSVAFLGSAGSARSVPQTGKIAALGALYVAVTYAISGAGSAAAVTAGNEEGRDNKYPRKGVANLNGLPMRMYSAHYNLMEMFPGWAIAAALTQAIAPADQTLINLLGLHVLSKVFLYYPSYLLNQDAPRSVAHIIATGSVMGVLIKLARRPLI